MTREDAIKTIWGHPVLSNINDVQGLISSIFDEFESRTCESCNGSFKSEGFTYCEKGSSPLSSCIFPIHPTFCCNRYEPKDKQ